MSEIPNKQSCCGPIAGLRQLAFSDGTQVGIVGLDAVMEILYRNGREADDKIASEIMEQLKDQNYFEVASRQQYEELFFKEYQKYLRTK